MIYNLSSSIFYVVGQFEIKRGKLKRREKQNIQLIFKIENKRKETKLENSKEFLTNFEYKN